MRINHSYKYRKIAGQHYLIPTRSEGLKCEAPIQLTETAAWIWTEVKKGTRQAEIAARMTEVYDVNQETAEAAVDEFLTALARKGMLETEDEAIDNSSGIMETEYGR